MKSNIRERLRRSINQRGKAGDSSGAGRSTLMGPKIERVSLLIVWVAVIIFFGILRPDTFLTFRNFAAMFGSQAVLVVLTLGLIVVLRAGDFDLSCASIATLSAMLIAVLNVQHGVPVWWAACLGLVIGALIGWFNGYMITRFGIHSLIVTLGSGTVLQGVILWISNGETITGVSNSLTNAVVGSRFLGIPLEFYYGIILTFAVWYLFEMTPFGRRLQFVGRGREVARLTGVAVSGVRVRAMVISGGVAAFAGVLYAGTTGSADPSSGLDFLLPAFAAGFLGATTIKPGFFNAWGTTVSVYFLITGITGLAMMGIRTFVQDLFYGGALLIAVTISQVIRGRREQEL